MVPYCFVILVSLWEITPYENLYTSLRCVDVSMWKILGGIWSLSLCTSCPCGKYFICSYGQIRGLGRAEVVVRKIRKLFSLYWGFCPTPLECRPSVFSVNKDWLRGSQVMVPFFFVILVSLWETAELCRCGKTLVG